MSAAKGDLNPRQSQRRGCQGLVIGIGVLITLGLAYLGIDLQELLGTLPGQSTPTPVVVVATPEDWYQVYFTEPTCPAVADRVGGVDELIAADIGSARSQVDIAAFDLDSTPIIDALIDAEKRGVVVRFVTDDEHNPAGTTNRLRRNGISVIEDRRSALMHNKFIVIDNEVLWTGSMNLTSNGVYCNDNNIVRFVSPQLAANYAIELAEMVDDRSFGPTSPRNTKTELVINGTRVESHFASEGEVAPVVARVVARADQEILVMAFSFTNADIGEAVIERADAGLEVRAVFENVGSDSRFSYFDDFRRAKLDNLQSRIDGNPRLMHHKVIIIDREIVIFGSFNFTNSANDSNDENLLIVYDRQLAAAFVTEFERVWSLTK